MTTLLESAQAAPELQIEQKESIKLIKNTKGYQWEIKILSLDISLLQKIDSELRAKFNDNNSEGGAKS